MRRIIILRPCKIKTHLDCSLLSSKYINYISIKVHTPQKTSNVKYLNLLYKRLRNFDMYINDYVPHLHFTITFDKIIL